MIHEWDGAYVLGALSPAERAEYEEHLSSCDQCREAVGELASLPGLLARVDPAAVSGAEPEVPAGLEERLLAAARPAPVVALWRRTPVRVGAGLAALLVAAALVVFAVVPRGSTGGSGGSGVDVALRAGNGLPLSADVTLTPADWGTKVHMTCRYEESGEGGARAYTLYVVDARGRAELVSSWRSRPGVTSRTDGSSDLSVKQIRSVELRAGDGTVLLRGQPGL